MHAFSPADGFLTVKEGVDDMIRYLANEPSAGLYFVQQHAQASMPNLLSVKGKLAEEVNEVTLHTEDIEDSITVVRSMAECGLPIADGMIKDINRSLHVMSSSQPKRGLIQNPSWGFQFSRAISSNSEPSNSEPSNSSGSNYFSTMFKSAKLRAPSFKPSFKWTSQEEDTAPVMPMAMEERSEGVVTQSEELAQSLHSHSSDSSSVLEEYDRFKTEQEVKLQEWLESYGADNNSK